MGFKCDKPFEVVEFYDKGIGEEVVIMDQLPIGAAVQQSIEVALFETLRHLPLYGLLVVVANILIASFFITSADSATFVIAKFSSAGREPSDPAAWLRP